MTQAEKILIKRLTEQVLHVPGNFTKNILEMTIVLDYGMEKAKCQERCIELLQTLKQHSKVFQNVRLNVTAWKSDEYMENQVVPISVMLLGRYFEGYETTEGKKDITPLMAYLKKFHARSKLIFLITDGQYMVGNREELLQNMKPFLGKKGIILQSDKIERFLVTVW